MHAIVSTEELSQIQSHGAIVGVLVAQQMNQEVLRWVFASWQQLHFDSGRNWHIAIPCYRNLRGGERPRTSLFCPLFSNKLREMYGIDRNDTPALVLDNFIDVEHQLYLKISNDEKERTEMFNAITNFINQQSKVINMNNDFARQQLIGELYNRMQFHKVGGVFLKYAPNAVSAAVRLLSRQS